MSSNNVILIFLADIVSHYIPTFFLARQLEMQGFTVMYVGNSLNTKEITESNGFRYIEVFTLEIMGRESNVITFRKLIKNIISDEIYKDRLRRYKEIVSEIKPKYLLIDIFASESFILLSQIVPSIEKYFLSPMLSTYYTEGVPSIRDYDWKIPRKFKADPISFSYTSWKIRFVSQSIYILNKIFTWLHCYKAGLIFGKHRIAFNNRLLLTFRNVPEFVLAPEELELSVQVRQTNQVYLGLCLDFLRKDYLMNENDRKIFSNIIREKLDENKRVVYVSFGTYFSSSEEYLSVSNFILALSECAKFLDNTIFIIATNSKIAEVLSNSISLRDFYIMERVPQLEVLKIADVFVTHGGLSSIKEAIHYKVPMLVYPLDKLWDQCGNSLKIIHHKLGLRGEIDHDEPADILSKLTTLFQSDEVKENVKHLSDQLENKYSKLFISRIMKTYFNSSDVKKNLIK